MPYTNTGSVKLGTASKTITLDLSVWANLSTVCNEKKYSLAKCLAYLAGQEAELLMDLKRFRDGQVKEAFHGNPNKVEDLPIRIGRD